MSRSAFGGDLYRIVGVPPLAIERATGVPAVTEGLKRVYGIDLGTTYSAIAYVDEHGKPVVVPNQESERITPSVVLFDGDNIIVGNTAKESAKVEPHRVVSRIKQHMGDPNFVFAFEGGGAIIKCCEGRTSRTIARDTSCRPSRWS